MNINNIEGLINTCGYSLELLRITRKSSGYFCYIPHSLVKRLNLTSQDAAFVGIFDDGLLILFKDRALQEALKPKILEARKIYEKITTCQVTK